MKTETTPTRKSSVPLPRGTKADTRLTADALFAYANCFARAREREGNGTEYPTVRSAARHFKVSQEAIRSAIDDYSGPGYMGEAVGARYGNRIGLYHKDSHRVEAYCDDEVVDE